MFSRFGPAAVLVRAGHTEGAVDIAPRRPQPVRRALRDHERRRHLARMSDLVEFAKTHELKIGTIADLIAYRLHNDRFVEKTLEAPFTSVHGGDFAMHVYVNKMAAEHVAW